MSSVVGQPSEHDSERLRILFVTSDKFPPFRPAAKAIFSEGLAAAGHEIDWVLQAADADCVGGARPWRSGTAYVAPTNRGGTRLARVRKYLSDLRNDWGVFGLLRTHEYSLVQIKDKYIGALIAICAARIHRVPTFYWLAYPHGEASSYAARQGLARYALFYALRGIVQRWLLYKVIIPASAHVFVQSEQMCEDIARHGIERAKMTPVPSSINLADVDALLRCRTDSTSRFSIVYLGTLLRERRLDFLVRVLARVRARVPEAELVFVGGGEMSDDESLLEREARACGVADAVTITGWLPMRTAWRHVRDAALCVSPYFPTAILRSTSPTKLIEYMALGKAVIGNTHPEQSAVIRRSGAGLLCEWRESEFADAAVFLLTNPDVADSMGRAGRCFVEERRTHDVMVELVLARYADTLSSLSRTGRRSKADARRTRLRTASRGSKG